MQLSKFSSRTIDIVVLYKSQQESQANLIKAVEKITEKSSSVLVLGDFNFCYLNASSNAMIKFMKGKNFLQLITLPTHIEGNLLDQAYLKDVKGALTVTANIQGKYYTDHKSLNVIVKR